MKISRQQLANLFTYAALFFLPWQTRWIYESLVLNREGWEYGKLSHYAVQLLIVVAVLLRWKIQASDQVKKVVKNGWVLYLVVLLSVVFSVDRYLSFNLSFHLLFALLLFWLLVDERIRLQKIIGFFTAGLIVPIMLGWWQFLAGSSPASTWFGLAEHLAVMPGTAVVETAGERLMRAYGSFPHPNIFGGYLAVAVMAVLGLGMSGRDAGGRDLRAQNFVPVHWGAAIIILVSGLVISFSRSAWLALAVGILVYLTASLIFKIKIQKEFLFKFAAVILTAAVTAGFFWSAIFTRVNLSERLESQSISERQTEYSIIDEVIKLNPITGVGFGAYTEALAKVVPNQSIWYYQPMHNVFLLILSEIGFVGFLFFVRWFASIDIINYRVARCRPGAFALGLGTTVLVLGLFDHYLWSQWAGLVLVVVALTVMIKSSHQ